MRLCWAWLKKPLFFLSRIFSSSLDLFNILVKKNYFTSLYRQEKQKDRKNIIWTMHTVPKGGRAMLLWCDTNWKVSGQWFSPVIIWDSPNTRERLCRVRRWDPQRDLQTLAQFGQRFQMLMGDNPFLLGNYLARTEADGCTFVFHFLNTCFLPLEDPPFWIWLLGIWPPKLLIKQSPLLAQKSNCMH